MSLSVSLTDGVLQVVFDRPQARNAMTFQMYEELHDACARADADEAVRVMVLRGAGGHFVAGTDIAQFASFRTGQDGIDYEARITRVVDRLEDLAVPTVAVVRGACVGGGLALASACDLRVAARSARFGVPIARTLGNCLSMGNYSRLVDMLGPSRTKYMLMTASLISAEEMKTAGYVHEIVEPDKIEARTYELAEQIATYAPITLYVTKEAIRRIAEQRVGTGGEDLVELTYGSDDFREGVSAFLEKRKPNWTGR